MQHELETKGYLDGEKFMNKPEEQPTLSSIVQRILNEVAKGHQETSLKVILRKQVIKALQGDTKAADFLLDRGYGKATQVIETNHAPVINIQHNVIYHEK